MPKEKTEQKSRPEYYSEWSLGDLKNGIQAMTDLGQHPGFRLFLQELVMQHEVSASALLDETDPAKIYRLQGEIKACLRFIGSAEDIKDYLQGLVKEIEYEKTLMEVMSPDPYRMSRRPPGA